MTAPSTAMTGRESAHRLSDCVTALLGSTGNVCRQGEQTIGQQEEATPVDGPPG